MEKAIIERIKHIETFYEQAPPGIVKEHEELPEECIPDTEGNRKAREFLAHAPKKGLWMPLGQEVKVMQCWKCKNYGHRTGDKECPLFESGNASNEKFREMYEDPMYSILNGKSRQDQSKKLQWLQHVLDQSSTDSSSDEERRKSKKKKTKNKEQWVEKCPEGLKDTYKSKKKKAKKDSKKHKKEQKHKLSIKHEETKEKRQKVKLSGGHKSGEHSRTEQHSDESVETNRHHKHKKEKKLKKHRH